MSTTGERRDSLRRAIRSRVPFVREQGTGFADQTEDPSQRQPGITRFDLVVINKIDLAPFVGASLGVMKADTLRMCGKRPFVFSNLKTGEGVEPITNFIVEKGGLAKTAAQASDDRKDQMLG